MKWIDTNRIKEIIQKVEDGIIKVPITLVPLYSLAKHYLESPQPETIEPDKLHEEISQLKSNLEYRGKILEWFAKENRTLKEDLSAIINRENTTHEPERKWSEWHSVKEIPEDDSWILVMNEQGHFWAEMTDKDDYDFNERFMPEEPKITHWRYIDNPDSTTPPPSPEKQEEGNLYDAKK